MDLTEWQEFRLNLTNLHLDYRSAYHESQNASNKAKRDAGAKKLSPIRMAIRQLIASNKEALSLINENPNSSGFELAINHDDFFHWRYLDGNLVKYIERIDIRIEEMRGK